VGKKESSSSSTTTTSSSSSSSSYEEFWNNTLYLPKHKSPCGMVHLLEPPESCRFHGIPWYPMVSHGAGHGKISTN